MFLKGAQTIHEQFVQAVHAQLSYVCIVHVVDMV